MLTQRKGGTPLKLPQKLLPLLGIGVFCTGLLLCLLGLSGLLYPEDRAVAAGAPAQPEYLYLVRAYRDQVAVFLPRQTHGPKYLTGIPVDSLPLADRQALAEGIPVYSDQQLTALLQDYGS